MLLTPILTPNVFLTREITWVASKECPPISKKLSSTSTRSSFSAAPKSPATISSTGVREATDLLSTSPRSILGAGNLSRSSFPFAVNGILSNITIAAGAIYSGSFCLRYPLNSHAVAFFCPHTPHRLPAAFLCRHFSGHHHRFFHSSLLIQRRFDLSQLDPKSSDLHLMIFSSQVLQVPVLRSLRHISGLVQPLPASSPYGSGMNLSAVSSALLRYPLLTPAPPTYNSPTTPTGAGSYPYPTHTLARPASLSRSGCRLRRINLFLSGR